MKVDLGGLEKEVIDELSLLEKRIVHLQEVFRALQMVEKVATAYSIGAPGQTALLAEVAAGPSGQCASEELKVSTVSDNWQDVVALIPPALDESAHEAASAQPETVSAQAETPLTEEEKLQHANALRVARLLASELKTYKEQMVREGHSGEDFNRRLMQEAEWQREVYDSTVPASVTRRNHYFNEEIGALLEVGLQG